MASRNIVVVEGEYDHIEHALSASGCPFRLVSASSVETLSLQPHQTVYVNCPGKLSTRSVQHLANFVKRGGQLITTDWALSNVLEVGFNGFVRWNERSTGTEVINLSWVDQDDDLVKDLCRTLTRGNAWHLESQSRPIAILSSRVQVLAKSHELERRYGDGPVIIKFSHGHGTVYHMISHYYQQGLCPHRASGFNQSSHELATFTQTSRSTLRSSKVTFHPAARTGSHHQCAATLDEQTRETPIAHFLQGLAERHASSRQPQVPRRSPLYSVSSELARALPDSVPLNKLQRRLFGWSDLFTEKRRGRIKVALSQQSQNVITRLVAATFLRHNAQKELDSLIAETVSEPLLDHRFTRIYSFKNRNYGLRGNRPYYKPKGWRRVGVRQPEFSDYKPWHVAYHGTMEKHVIPILLNGLQRPGEHGAVVEHGQAGSASKKTIYTSPSIEYAGHPVYAQLFEESFMDPDTNSSLVKLSDSPEHWGQLALQCRVHPGSFTERKGTLGRRHWPKHLRLDENFPSHNGLEWLLEDPGAVIVYGLMVREFGPGADASIYGDLVTKVTDRASTNGNGPEYVWTDLLADEYERRALYTIG